MLQHTTIHLSRLRCGSEGRTVERALGAVPGVQTVYVNPVTETAYVTYDPEAARPEQLIEAAASTGYLEPESLPGHPAPRFPGPASTALAPTGSPGVGDPRRRARWVGATFLVILGFFLVTEHRAHRFGVLPYLLLLACPLLHLVLHGRHRGPGEGHAPHPHAERAP